MMLCGLLMAALTFPGTAGPAPYQVGAEATGAGGAHATDWTSIAAGLRARADAVQQRIDGVRSRLHPAPLPREETDAMAEQQPDEFDGERVRPSRFQPPSAAGQAAAAAMTPGATVPWEQPITLRRGGHRRDRRLRAGGAATSGGAPVMRPGAMGALPT